MRPVPMPELEDRPVARELDEEVDDGIHDRRHRLVGVALVVVLGHGRAEAVDRHQRASTRTALTLYSGVPMSGSPTSCVSQLTFACAKWSDIQTRPG